MNEVEQLKAQLAAVEKELEEERQLVKGLEGNLAACEKEFERAEQQLAAVTKELDEAERKIPTTADAMAHFSLLNKLDEAQKQLAASHAREADLRHLIDVIEAHEIESLSCDRDGETHCDCLKRAAKDAKDRLSPSCGSHMIDARELEPLRILDMTIGTAESIAWHFEQGQVNGGLTRDALAKWLRGLAETLKANNARLTALEGKR